MQVEVQASMEELALGAVLDIEGYCRERGYPFLKIAETGPLGKKFNSGREFVAYVEDVQVFADGYLAVEGGTMIRGLAHANYGSGIAVKVKDSVRREAPQVVEEAVLCWGNENFGHFIFQFLARMTQCFRMPFLMDKPVLLKRGLPEGYKEWLRRIGFTRFIEADEWVRVKRLWVPAVCNYRGHFDDNKTYFSVGSCLGLRKCLLPPTATGPEKLYIARQGAKHRRCLNEEELLAELEGFTVMDMAGMPMQDQINAVASAKTIVLTNGGASVITMFAPMGCKIVELTNQDLIGVFGSMAWASILRQRFHRVKGEIVGEGRRIDKDFVIDVGAVVGLTQERPTMAAA